MDSFGNSKALPKYLSQAELKKFFSILDSPRDKALFVLIYHYGLRESEALWLTVNDIDLKRNRILIKRLKNGVAGERPLWRDTAKTVKAYLKVRIPKGTPLFTGRQGPLTSRRVRQLFASYAKKANLPKNYSVHSLRHSIAVHLLDAGQPIEMVQDHLGHRNITNTAIYARISNVKREAMFHDVERNPAVVRA